MCKVIKSKYCFSVFFFFKNWYVEYATLLYFLPHLGPLLLIRNTSSHLLKDVANDTPLRLFHFTPWCSRLPY